MQTIIIVSLIPVVTWFSMEPITMRFGDFVSSMTSIGQLLGILGMTLFSISLILSGRLKVLDRYFKGLDKVYIKHHKIGAIAFSMILFHPLFLVVRYITISIKDAGMFFVPFVNMPITWGIISIIIMLLLIIFTFYINLKYHKWKISHKFMIVAFIFAMMHTFMIGSDISRNAFLKFYILIISILGLVISVRKTFFSKIFIKKYKYIVKSTTNLNNDVMEVEMSPLKEKLNHQSGQFIFINFDAPDLRESHPFTIASNEKEENIRLIIKNFGDFTSKIKELKAGTIAIIDGPYGNFSYKNYKGKDQIWIAGGIGITPFLSMAGGIGSDYNISLYYSVKQKDEAVYTELLAKLSESNNNFKFNLWSASERGYITAEEISKENDIQTKEIFLCGPPVFMEGLKSQFIEKGVDINQIHYEKFNL